MFPWGWAFVGPGVVSSGLLLRSSLSRRRCSKESVYTEASTWVSVMLGGEIRNNKGEAVHFVFNSAASEEQLNEAPGISGRVLAGTQ